MKVFYQQIPVFVILPMLLILLGSNIMAGQSSWIDSAQSGYSLAAKQYDSELLKKAAAIITRQPDEAQQTARPLLVLGFIYWQEELIAYCQNNASEVNHYGKLALEILDKAEKAGADSYLTASHKALACQLLAGLGISKGARYGPQAASELKKAQKANPQGYFSLLVEATNSNQAPAFAGGSPAKAVLILEKMAAEFPDSVPVKIHLSDAYIKVGRSEEARRLLGSIIQKYPLDLLARKIAAKHP
jgi:hypothetical protein